MQCDSKLDFGKRLIEDLKTIAPTNTRLRVYAPPERARSAWIGGCVLTSLSPFGNMWITKEEWETEGSVIVHKKSLMLSVSSKQKLKDSEHLGVFGEVFCAPLALQRRLHSQAVRHHVENRHPHRLSLLENRRRRYVEAQPEVVRHHAAHDRVHSTLHRSLLAYPFSATSSTVAAIVSAPFSFSTSRIR